MLRSRWIGPSLAVVALLTVACFCTDLDSLLGSGLRESLGNSLEEMPDYGLEEVPYGPTPGETCIDAQGNEGPCLPRVEDICFSSAYQEVPIEGLPPVAIPMDPCDGSSTMGARTRMNVFGNFTFMSSDMYCTSSWARGGQLIQQSEGYWSLGEYSTGISFIDVLEMSPGETALPAGTYEWELTCDGDYLAGGMFTLDY